MGGSGRICAYRDMHPCTYSHVSVATCTGLPLGPGTINDCSASRNHSKSTPSAGNERRRQLQQGHVKVASHGGVRVCVHVRVRLVSLDEWG